MSSDLLQTAQSRHRAGDLVGAEQAYRQLLSLDSKNPAGLHGLGILLFQQRRIDAALDCLRAAAAGAPRDADCQTNYGVVLAAAGRHDEAINAFTVALECDPEHIEARYNLAESLCKIGKPHRAIAEFRQAIDLYPDFPEALTSLGRTLMAIGDNAGAVSALRRVVEILPSPSAATLSNLAMAESAAGDVARSVELLRRATELEPRFASAWHNLGSALKECGDIDGAIAAFDQAISIDPGFVPTHSNRLFAMHFHPAYDAKTLYREHVLWRKGFIDPVRLPRMPHANDTGEDRRLRIGYVSPDFRAHVVGWNLLPLFSHHDHKAFEIFCYSDVSVEDMVTRQLAACADVWHKTFGLTDAQLASQINQDRIDILVDLALHTSGNRLLVFAHKPAPVQVTWLGYCSTTGLETIDYRLSDPHMDPPDASYTEETIRLPLTFWCYQPGGPTPEVVAMPALSTGRITFGCLNNFAKVSPPAIAAWAQIMTRVPRSRLIIHAPPGSHRDKFLQTFESNGVAKDRIEFVARVPWPEYIQLYQRLDITLDPFPFGGGITTCDSLQMGVPVVTLSGATAVGRGGRSILLNLDLGELIASNVEDYTQIAVALAGDIPRLASLRTGLRQRLNDSPVMNAIRFTRDIESAFRGMWRRWTSSNVRISNT